MIFFGKRKQKQPSFEESIFILAKNFHKMKLFMYSIVNLLKDTKHIENNIEQIMKELSSSRIQFDAGSSLLRDFYTNLSEAKAAHGEARNILLHLNLKENNEIIEKAFQKFKESFNLTKEAQNILKKIRKYRS